MFDLDYKFNRMDLLDKFIGISRLDSYIVHYAGAPRNVIMDVLLKDIQQWEQDSPEYKYNRNILISVTAGMGDQLCAEPAIRYTQKIYPDANIFVVSHFTRLFEHLDMPVFDYEQWKGINDAILTMYSCPDDEQSEHRLSHVLFHPTDFASMSMIKRTIPNEEKTIKLKVNIEDVSSVIDMLKDKPKDKKLVLIHPGKWWPSKTFPVEWWQEVIDKLSEKLCVGIIGKTIDKDQGYLPVQCPADGFDFRDITSLGELIALISLTKCLVTNDSSPLHIAGAFDNWIVTMPTCKHADHILPFRNGSQYYKTKALQKKLLLDDLEIRHTEFLTDTIDKIPAGKEEKQPTAKIPTHKYNKVSPIGKNQIDYKRSLESNTLTIVRGPAGTGKTFLASVEAAELLRDGIIKNIVLVRPYVDLNNRGIGYLKGTEHEKLEPYVRPMLDAIKYVVGPLQLQKYLEEGAIEVKALASIRGMSYKETFLICDEMQGTVPNEIQALTTRIGKDSKMVIVGDTRQTDVRQGKENGLDYLIRIVNNYPIRDTGVIEMDINDIQRSGITKDFVLAYEKEGWQ
jgi:phosphate starvation-inducible protein PhoH